MSFLHPIPAVRGPNNLRLRLITAAILLPLVTAAWIFGPPVVVEVFLVASLTLSVGEMALMVIPAFERKLAAVDLNMGPETMAGRVAPRGMIFPAIAVLLGIAILLLSANAKASAQAAVGGVTLAALFALVLGVFSAARSIDLAAARAFGILVSLVYGALPWLVVWQLYLMAPHARYVLLVMTVTWCGDTGAYFGGRYLGGRIFGDLKLAPAISPKKTWEGALAGLLASVIGAQILNVCFMGELGSPGFLSRLALVSGAMAQLGDLVESTFKRFSGVKDSGVIMPGHGGFLDRVDGILFAAPVIWAMLYYFR